MSVITQNDFHTIYGPGRPPVAGSPNYTPEADVRVVTALVDHYKCKRCLEIGCNVGGTSAAMLAGNTTIEEYIGLDIPEIMYNNGNLPAGHLALADPRFRVMQPKNGARDIKLGDIELCDFIFIDGAHDYASVKADTELAHALLAPGGIVVWHDYQHPRNMDVAKLIHEINDKPGVPPIVWVKATFTCYKIMSPPENKPEASERTTSIIKETRKSKQRVKSVE